MTFPPIAADARKAGWEHLCDKRNALGRVLLNAEEEYGKNNEAAARTDPEKARREAADEADRGASNKPWDVHLLAPSAYAYATPTSRSGYRQRRFSSPCDLIDVS